MISHKSVKVHSCHLLDKCKWHEKKSAMTSLDSPASEMGIKVQLWKYEYLRTQTTEYWDFIFIFVSKISISICFITKGLCEPSLLHVCTIQMQMKSEKFDKVMIHDFSGAYITQRIES